MTNQQHPITPPPELMEEWRMDYIGRGHAFIDVATKVVQWGADQELEACCGRQLRIYGSGCADELRAARRPKPPNLKEEAKQIIDCLIEGDCLNDDDAVTLCRVLEALPND